MEELKAHGRVERPWLGVQVAPIGDSLHVAEIPVDHGLLVQRVIPGGPAARAGVLGGQRSVILSTGQELLVGGDVIVKIGDVAVNDSTDFQHALEPYQPGDTVPVTLLRNGAEQTVSVELGNRPAGQPDG